MFPFKIGLLKVTWICFLKEPTTIFSWPCSRRIHLTLKKLLFNGSESPKFSLEWKP